jgi:hypothetical protein
MTDGSRPKGALPAHPAGAPSACARVVGGLSDEEVEVLARLRAVRAEAAAVRAELDGVVGEGAESAGPRAALTARLGELRDAWRRLAAERDAARHRRMVLLGHADDAAGEAPLSRPDR